MLKPSSIFLSLLLKQWNVSIKDKSLPNAGKWIGYLERILILTFMLTNSIEGVGFLLAAKSVFRFGDYYCSEPIAEDYLENNVKE